MFYENFMPPIPDHSFGARESFLTWQSEKEFLGCVYSEGRLLRIRYSIFAIN